ncbi:MAG TPA: recombinase family protein [Candidatus Dojkabacteria bacterium]|nr:recombinase family protein [Candidatus Dojkabacteria bacterium]
MKLRCYVRISTEGQQDNYSIPQQRADAEAFAKQQHCTDFLIYEDVRSGADITRIGWNKLLADIENGECDCVWVGRPDRFSRNTQDGLMAIDVLRKHNVRYFIGGIEYDIFNEYTKLLITMQFAFSELERNLIKQRTMMGKIRAANSGNRINNNTLGYENVGKKSVKIIDDEAEMVRKIFTWYAVDNLSYKQIAYRLNTEGYKCKKYGQTFHYKDGSEKKVGLTWTDARMPDIIKRPEYVGLTWNWNKTELIKSNIYPPIIDKELWDKANNKFKQRTKETTYKGYRITYHTVSGLVRCKKCGAGYFFRDGKYQYYVHKVSSQKNTDCTQLPTCLTASTLEDAFAVLFINTFTNTDELKKLYDLSSKAIEKDRQELEAIEKRIGERIDDINTKLKRFTVAIESGMDIDDIKQRYNELKDERSELEKNLDKAKKEYQLKTTQYDEIARQFTVDSLGEFIQSDGKNRRLIYFKTIRSAEIDDKVLTIEFITGRIIKLDVTSYPAWLMAQIKNYQAGLYSVEWINEKRLALSLHT